MFGLTSTKISTKNLYLVEISMVKNIRTIGFLDFEYQLEGMNRYALARKHKYLNEYIDIFTGTKYSCDLVENSEKVMRSRAIITSKKYITTEEATYILQELNPTYLKENKGKEKVKKR